MREARESDSGGQASWWIGSAIRAACGRRQYSPNCLGTRQFGRDDLADSSQHKRRNGRYAMTIPTLHIRFCCHCGKPIPPEQVRKKAHFCSDACRFADRNAARAEKKLRMASGVSLNLNAAVLACARVHQAPESVT